MWFLIKQIHSSRCPDWKMAVKKATLSLHNLRIHFRRQIRSQQSHKSPFEVNIYFKNKTETKKCASAISNATNEIMKVWKKRRIAVPLDRNLLFCWPRRAVYFQKCCSVRQMCLFYKERALSQMITQPVWDYWTPLFLLYRTITDLFQRGGSRAEREESQAQGLQVHHRAAGSQTTGAHTFSLERQRWRISSLEESKHQCFYAAVQCGNTQIITRMGCS